MAALLPHPKGSMSDRGFRGSVGPPTIDLTERVRPTEPERDLHSIPKHDGTGMAGQATTRFKLEVNK